MHGYREPGIVRNEGRHYRAGHRDARECLRGSPPGGVLVVGDLVEILAGIGAGNVGVAGSDQAADLHILDRIRMRRSCANSRAGDQQHHSDRE